MRKISLILLLTLCLSLFAASAVPAAEADELQPGQTEQGLLESDQPATEYYLDKVIILSRHSIRSPMSEKGSILDDLTPHEWFTWTSAPSELSLRGAMLETTMGQYFRLWLEKEGLFPANYIPEEGAVRFYANGLQRTLATAHYFSTGLLPVAVVPVERHVEYNEQDDTFLPVVHFMNDAYKQDVLEELYEIAGGEDLSGVRASLDDAFNLLVDVTDMMDTDAYQSGKYGDFLNDGSAFSMEPGQAPALSGPIKTAYSLAEALVLQYYEEPDTLKAAFGHELTEEDWRTIGSVIAEYAEILFGLPLLSINQAHPMLEEIYSEMNTEERKFTFLCGHESTLTSVMAALGVEEYSLPEAIEPKTPVGTKMVFERWTDQEGEAFYKVELMYQSIDELRYILPLSLETPPVIVPISFEGIEENADGMIPEKALMELFEEKIGEYYALEEAERFGTLEWYSSFTPGNTIKDSFYYSDDWFLEDPEVQNDALALVSMQLTAAAVENDENGNGTSFLKSLGFEQTGLSGFDDPDPSGCSLTWGTKTIGEGEDAFTLVAIAIQSLSFDQTVKQNSWKQNFLVNGETITAEHFSYAEAADRAAALIEQLDISGKVKYWITGQSRGGTLAGVLATRLKNDADSVYAYTFETPANVEKSAVSENASDYSYIHNYLCSDDVVTMIPPWGMTRYGAEHKLNTDETVERVADMLQKTGSDAASLAQDYDPDAIEEIATGLIKGLNDKIPSREDYSALNTDLFTDTSGQEVSISYRYQDVFTGLMKLAFGNAFEGIDLLSLADELPKLLPTVSSLYRAVKENSDPYYYEAASGLALFLKNVGIELPLTLDDMYVLLKLAGSVIINEDFVPEGDEITEDEMLLCVAPVIEIIANKDSLVFSHQFDTIIARLKILAEEPEMENPDFVIPEPEEGEAVSSFVSQTEDAFRDLGYSWLTASAEVKTKDEQFLNDKIYYLSVNLDVVGHSIPEDFTIAINGKESVEPLEITYADGITDITGTWEYVLGTPDQVMISFDTEGRCEAPENIYTETGNALKYAVSYSFPEIVSDDTGIYAFDGWYDENGNPLEECYADDDIILCAKWIQMIDNIEVIYDIPNIGEESGRPIVAENAPYQITEVRLMDGNWDEVTEICDPGEYELDFIVHPVSEEHQFLTYTDEEDYEIYAGVLIINGEAADTWFEAEENGVSASYRFTVLPDPAGSSAK